MATPSPEWLTVKETAAATRTNPMTVYRWIYAKRVAARKVAGTTWRVAFRDGVPLHPEELN